MAEQFVHLYSAVGVFVQGLTDEVFGYLRDDNIVGEHQLVVDLILI